MDARYSSQEGNLYSSSSGAAPNYQQGTQNSGSAPFGSRFAAYRDNVYRDGSRPHAAGGAYSTPSSSPHLIPAVPQQSPIPTMQQQQQQLQHQLHQQQLQQHLSSVQSLSAGYGIQNSANGASGRPPAANQSYAYVEKGVANNADGRSAGSRIRSPPQSIDSGSSHIQPQRSYGREDRMADSVPYDSYSTVTKVTPLIQINPAAEYKPLTPRRRENEMERSSARSHEKQIPEPRLSSDFVRHNTMSGKPERGNVSQSPEDITNLMKERDKIRSQQDIGGSQAAEARSEHARQNEILKERDLLRTQFEELSNRYQVLLRSLRVLEEQSSAEQGKNELTIKKLKDAEANATSLQSHHTVLARENQLLKEQLGKVLRLHESERVILQSQVHNLESHLSTARSEASDFREKTLSISEQFQANQAKNSSQEEKLNAAAQALHKLQQTLYRTSVLFNKKSQSSKCFFAWKSHWTNQSHGVSEIAARTNATFLKAYVDDWARSCHIAASQKIRNDDLNSLHEASNQRLKTVLVDFERTKDEHKVQIEALKRDFAATQDSLKREAEELQLKYEQERRLHQIESEELSSLKAEMAKKLSDAEAAWVQKMEISRSKHELEVSNLSSRFEQLQAELCEKLVNSRSSSLEQLEQLRAEQSRNDREWRQKLIDKEKMQASHLEEVEKQRVQGIEDMQQEMQSKEREWVNRTDALRAEHSKAQEDLRQKLLLKEREMATKMEAAREQHIRAQEEFQAERQEREKEFKRALESKEQDFQSIIESHVSNSSNSATKLLQSRLALQDATVREKENQIQVLKAERETALAKEQSLQTEIEALRTRLKSQSMLFDGNGTESSAALKARISQLESSLQIAERTVNIEKQKSGTLSIELEAASQTLIKRGDDFAGTIRILQGRLESKDSELQSLQEKLWAITSTNAALIAEVEKSTTPHTGLDSILNLQNEKNSLQEEIRSQHQEWQNRYSTLQNSSQAEILDLKSQLMHMESQSSRQGRERSAPPPTQFDSELPELLQQAEAENERLRKFLGSIEQENTTLTNELDNVLLENAQLRQRLDNAQFDEDQISDSYGSAVHNLPLHGSRDATRSRDYFPRYGVTCGVHTTRLKRSVFDAWFRVIAEVRLWGRNHTFNCLEYFISSDGSPANWFPVGRVRKADFDIKTEKIGSGTFAEVLKGELKIPCAIKRIKGPVQQAEILEFVREGEMMRAINHPCIVRLLGVQSEPGQYHLLQEYVNGPNLFDYLHKFHKTVPIGKQFGIAVQICDALIYIHQLRIVHRDVKTQNMIYVEKTGVVKLCDFGLARLMPHGVSAFDLKHLGTGGTPAYQGPEVLKRHPVGLKLDLYGFAISLWEMYTAKLPWSDCSLDQMTVRVAVQKERPRIPSDMPREYAEIISRCWHDDPNMRPNFSDILRPLVDMHDSLNPKSRLTMSASSIASTIAASNGSAGGQSQQTQRMAVASAGQVPQQRYTATIAQF